MGVETIPFKNVPPTLKDLPGTFMELDKQGGCHNCKHFESSLLSSPCGWCDKYPSKQVNCGIGTGCNEWESNK